MQTASPINNFFLHNEEKKVLFVPSQKECRNSDLRRHKFANKRLKKGAVRQLETYSSSTLDKLCKKNPFQILLCTYIARI